MISFRYISRNLRLASLVKSIYQQRAGSFSFNYSKQRLGKRDIVRKSPFKLRWFTLFVLSPFSPSRRAVFIAIRCQPVPPLRRPYHRPVLHVLPAPALVTTIRCLQVATTFRRRCRPVLHLVLSLATRQRQRPVCTLYLTLR